MITHTIANSVDRNGAKRSIQFYKSSRPQAPVRHKADPALAGLVECSCCRGLFFKQDRQALADHRRWHEANAVDGMFYPMSCKLAVQAHAGRYMFEHTCADCGEDLCPCQACEDQHEDECEKWQEVQALLDRDDAAGADALAR